MADTSPIWPSQLDHIRIDSDDPGRLIDFYRDALGLRPAALGDGTCLMQGPKRRLIIGRGRPGERPYHGFRVQNGGQLDAIRSYLSGQGVELLPSPTPVFGADGVAVRDPDGWLNVFGLPRTDLPAGEGGKTLAAASLPGRLQHVVVATQDLAGMMAFYEDVLGFVPSDYVTEGEGDGAAKTAAFYRSDPEHHSFAVFAAPAAGADHHCYETTSWNDIRDWADHFSDLNVKLWWGPGRHGPGNNLFFMIQDPHGDQIEISAELEIMTRDQPPRLWPHEERSLNLWGPGWMRT